VVLRSINDGVEHLSPAPRLFITQIGLEPVLKEQAAKLGARLEYGAEVMSLEGGDDGATAVVRDRETGRERTVGRATLSPPTGRTARSGSNSGSRRAGTAASPRASRSTFAPMCGS
jgi:FAD binding domain